MIEIIQSTVEFLKWLVLVYGGIGIFLTMIIQAIIVVIPSEGVLMAAGILGMHPLMVALWAGSGSIAGASISFYIGKKGGRPLVKKLIGEKGIKFADNWAKRWGNKAVLIGRLVPFIPYDPISYLSGVTSMKFKEFSIYNAIGTFPRALMFAYIGTLISQFNYIGLAIFGIVVGILAVAYKKTKNKYEK